MKPSKPTTKPVACLICGNHKEAAETWFLVSHEDWEDRLQIWKWDSLIVDMPNAFCLCSPQHVRELVVHWMLTGCLQYPFATAADVFCGLKGDFDAVGERHHIGALHLGEIAVDREAVLRAMRDNPLCLNTILDELHLSLEKELAVDTETDPEDDLNFALRSV